MPRNRLRSTTLTATLVAVVVGLSACVGPSRSHEDYQRKVAHSAEAIISTSQAVLLTVDTAEDGRAPAPFVSLRIAEAEDAVGAVETSFGAVQPPDPELDKLRAELLTVIGKAGDVIEELRIAAFRGELDRLSATAGDLERLLRELQAFTEIAPT